VDDEEHIRKIMSIMLGKKGYACRLAASGEEALGAIKKESFDAVLTDLNMPGLDGLGLLARIKETDPELEVIVVTAFATIETAILAMKAGAYDYIAKPFNEDEMVLVLEKALERGRLLAENQRLKREMGERLDSGSFLGSSQAMKNVFALIAKVAEVKATVLITGESGTGKELAAQSIHRNGPRRDKPFVAVNCGAIPANLLESEFFGHVRGAFTGADRAKEGLLAEADGGTLFLDEVAELPLEMQVKFLRVLQEEEIRRVGDNVSRKVDLRVLAATNRNLTEEVASGRFREDLYYRLNVIRLNLPPLRERPEDIPILAVHFLAQAVQKNQLPPKTLSPAALRVLSAQTYSGNVRALKNIIEQAAIMSDGETIGPKDLPFSSDAIESPAGLVLKIPEDWLDLKVATQEVIKTLEEILLKRALSLKNGNQSQAAKVLGISRRSIITKVQTYGLGSKRKAPPFKP
jgi:two-component system response regulator AtoC